MQRRLQKLKNEKGGGKVTASNTSLENGNFQYNNDTNPKEKELLPMFKAFLYVSDEEIGIYLASNIIDIAKLVRLFISSDDNISKFVSSESSSEIVLSDLSIYANEPLFSLAPEPIKPNKDIFIDFENSYYIQFRECEEFAESVIYDRLLYAFSNMFDILLANSELKRIKAIIQHMNPLFHNAKVNRLLEWDSHVFEGQSLSLLTLADIYNMKSWSISLSVAKEIATTIEKKQTLLVVPKLAIESLTAELSEREKYIVENRYLKPNKTLEELGLALRLTRERVRQIAVKIERKLNKSHNNSNLIKSIFFTLKVLCECEYCITASEINKYEVSEDILLFLSDVLGGKMLMAHISETDCIPFYCQDGKCEWLDQIEKATDSIPELLLPDEQQNIIKEVSSLLMKAGFIIPNNIISAIVFRKYIKNGTALVKRSLRMGDKYEIVLEKFFPDGIKLYQTEDMELFRKGYDALFEDDKISDNDHAVVSRITERCVLINRGTYILNKKTELPVKLLQQILDYIVHYPFDMVMTNAIMHKFNTELTDIGVDNKYYLLSVLKQHFSHKFTFRRDYVIKGEATSNFYGNITGFVELNPTGVNFHDLQVHFQGIPDALLCFALTEDDNIIPMYNKMYMHKNNIIFPERNLVLALLKRIVSQEHIVSDERAYSLIKRDYPAFIANNNINTGWFLFSILRSFFQDEFKFSRPHIIDSSFDSANGREALKSSFWGKSYVDIADIKNYAKEKQIQIYDLSKLLDSYNDRYFILNKERLIRVDEIGYDPNEFFQVEEILMKAIGNLEFAEISKLNVINSLPKASVALTEWIIYSIINKYGTQISAITSTPQFMNSVPLVICNRVDIESVRDEYASSGASTQTVKIDDLSDIDNLVEGIIESDFVWEGNVH